MPPKGSKKAKAAATTPASRQAIATPRAQTSPYHVPAEDEEDEPSQTPATATKSRGKAVPTSATSTRPKRGAPVTKTPKPIGSPSLSASSIENDDAPTSMIEKDVKKRGRPARAKAEDIIQEAADTLMQPETVEPLTEGVPTKKRGRPAKTVVAPAAEEEQEEELEELPKKRGRPASRSVTEPLKKRGRPAKTETAAAEPPKKRGRPAKTSPEVSVEISAEDEDAAEEPPEKRGRPRKDAFASPPESVPPKKAMRAKSSDIQPRRSTRQPARDATADLVELPATKKRGNKAATQKDTAPTTGHRGRGRGLEPAAETEVESEPEKEEEHEVEQELEDSSAADEPSFRRDRGLPKTVKPQEEEAAQDEELLPKRGRGRPKGTAKPAATKQPTTKPAAKRRIRPPGSTKKVNVEVSEPEESEESESAEEAETLPKHAHYHAAMDGVDDQVEDELLEAADSTTRKSSGSKRKTSSTLTKGRPTKKTKGQTDADDVADTGAQYWLMKAEPNTRIERNADGEDVDVRFSIEDLRSRSEPEPWEGIRNGQAQNNLKAMKKGDLAFFYESNCKVPGIVGIMEIVQEASPDHAAFDRKSAYFDPKGDASNPKWMLVHVQFKQKFPSKVSLKDLQKHSKSGDVLENMGLVKQSRLSVSKVSKAEWDFVMQQVEDDAEDEDGKLPGEEEETPAEDLDAGSTAEGAHAATEVDKSSTPDGNTITNEYAEASAKAQHSGFLNTIGSALGLTRSPSRGRSKSPALTTGVKDTVEAIVESVEKAAGTAAHSIADTVGAALPATTDLAKKTSRATSKARSDATGLVKEAASRAGSRAPSVRSSSRRPSFGNTAERAASKVKNMIGGVDEAFKAQTDTILEGSDGEEDNAVAISELQGGFPSGGDVISGAGGEPGVGDEEDSSYYNTADIEKMDF
ncbi:hypothetical protein AAFC00_002151 [Neodothiora populina]|uniref:EVE domain-containing protein n=1 Tax=Neodothiora populina TaxID=2781224 RepID=A0ABR3PGH9_9PEZI